MQAPQFRRKRQQKSLGAYVKITDLDTATTELPVITTNSSLEEPLGCKPAGSQEENLQASPQDAYNHPWLPTEVRPHLLEGFPAIRN